MRLRPSGRKGPVATSLQSFASYQQDEAWTWEHLALTRARIITGPARLMTDVEQTIEQVLIAHAADTRVLPDLAEMRDRLADAKAPDSHWDVKLGPGRLQELELLTQAACLRASGVATSTPDQIALGVKSGWLSSGEADALTAAHRLFWQVQATARLLTGGVFDPDAAGAGAIAMMLRETETSSLDALAAALESAAEDVAQIMTRKLEDAINERD